VEEWHPTLLWPRSPISATAELVLLFHHTVVWGILNLLCVIIAALHSRCGHYIFILWLLLSYLLSDFTPMYSFCSYPPFMALNGL